MREIKFRAWGIHSEEFLQGEEGQKGFTLQQISNIHLIENWDFMQYTGLKDKNGVDVYEGDVVDWKQSEPSNYEIQFIEGGFCLTRPELEGCTTDIASVYPSYGCQIEVIGNIYENPDLLTNN